MNNANKPWTWVKFNAICFDLFVKTLGRNWCTSCLNATHNGTSKPNKSQNPIQLEMDILNGPGNESGKHTYNESGKTTANDFCEKLKSHREWENATNAFFILCAFGFRCTFLRSSIWVRANVPAWKVCEQSYEKWKAVWHLSMKKLPVDADAVICRAAHSDAIVSYLFMLLSI